MPRLESLAHSGNYIIPYPHAFVTSKTYPDLTRLYPVCPDYFALLRTPVLRFCALAAAMNGPLMDTMQRVILPYLCRGSFYWTLARFARCGAGFWRLKSSGDCRGFSVTGIIRTGVDDARSHAHPTPKP